MLEIPSYINALNIPTTDVKKKGQVFNTGKFFGVGGQFEEMEEDFESLKSRSFAAQLAFSVATAEWLVWRVSKLVDVKPMLNYLGAMWAAQLDSRYPFRLNPNDVYDPNDLSQPHLRMPPNPAAVKSEFSVVQNFCGFLLNECCHNTSYVLAALIRKSVAEEEGSQTSMQHCQALCYHVQTTLNHKDRVAFINGWVKPFLERLKTFYSIDPTRADPDTLVGSPIPREVADPSINYDLAKAADLVEKFRRTLDNKKNPYLLPAESLKNRGFSGEPYLFQ